MSQKTISELEGGVRPQPYTGRITGKVIKVGHTAKFQNSSGVQGKMLNFKIQLELY